ncbi:MAG: CoA transferase, partial [Oscillospiraceae bacterium]
MSNDILKGIKVVELGTHVAVPYCTRILADWGAEVVKIEPPRGESYRNIGHLFHMPVEEQDNIMYTPYNLNKSSLCLNLTAPESVEVMYKLLADADVFATNTRPRALEKMGLGLETLKEKFPRLIVVHLNGFGEVGPEKDRPGYDAAAFWCRSGAIDEWTTKGDRPFKPFYGYGDAVTSSQLLSGVLAALYQREKTGKGDLVHISLYAAGLFTNVAGVMRPQFGHKFPKGHMEPVLPLDNFYPTKDGKWVFISEEHWETRCDAYFDMLGHPEMKGDPKYCTLKGYITSMPELIKMFDEEFPKIDSETIKETMIKIDTVFEFVTNPADVYTDEQALANDFLREIQTPGGTKVTIPNSPITFDSQGKSEWKTYPLLGEHSAEILKKLGYTDEQIAG